jgi:hypothetical protein
VRVAQHAQLHRPAIPFDRAAAAVRRTHAFLIVSQVYGHVRKPASAAWASREHELWTCIVYQPSPPVGDAATALDLQATSPSSNFSELDGLVKIVACSLPNQTLSSLPLATYKCLSALPVPLARAICALRIMRARAAESGGPFDPHLPFYPTRERLDAMDALRDLFLCAVEAEAMLAGIAVAAQLKVHTGFGIVRRRQIRTNSATAVEHMPT